LVFGFSFFSKIESSIFLLFLGPCMHYPCFFVLIIAVG
jgi:hypothetical protein